MGLPSETRLRCPHCGEAWVLDDREALLVAARLLVIVGELNPVDLIPVTEPSA